MSACAAAKGDEVVSRAPPSRKRPTQCWPPDVADERSHPLLEHRLDLAPFALDVPQGLNQSPPSWPCAHASRQSAVCTAHSSRASQSDQRATHRNPSTLPPSSARKSRSANSGSCWTRLMHARQPLVAPQASIFICQLHVRVPSFRHGPPAATAGAALGLARRRGIALRTGLGMHSRAGTGGLRICARKSFQGTARLLSRTQAL